MSGPDDIVTITGRRADIEDCMVGGDEWYEVGLGIEVFALSPDVKVSVTHVERSAKIRCRGSSLDGSRCSETRMLEHVLRKIPPRMRPRIDPELVEFHCPKHGGQAEPWPECSPPPVEPR